MNKLFIFCILLVFTLVVTTACSGSNANKPNMIQSKRRFAQYVEQNQNPNAVDLSEGPRLKYDMDMGPKDLNFDIKITSPF